jgi:succinate dehydrogenase / fumarate reductase cytochrome b subunit
MDQRPLSPHISIYRPQITSILSILHRFTGISLIIGAIAFCMGFLAFALGESYWRSFCDVWHMIGGSFWQWCIIFSLHFHAFNGIRHLFWDMGKGFDLTTLTRTGYIIVGLSVFLTGVLLFSS